MSSPRQTWSRSSPGGRSCDAPPDRVSPAGARSTRRRRRRSPSTRSRSSTTASAAGRGATSSRSSARRRTSTSSAPSSGSPSASASRSRSRRRHRASRRNDAGASACTRCSTRRPAYFERLLWDGEAGAPVREYLASRGLGEEVAKEFRLGLAPGQGLAEKAKERGFTLDELKSAGLVTARGTDYFPQRLMFPLADARGRVVGFQARKLREDDPLRGKYVNSPEGDLFHKSAVLYGLHLAKAAIGKQDFAAVVEGNTDVIALRQAGFEPVVASMGTALTERQLRELGRMTKKVVLCFDADAAGQDATLRGMELAVGQGFDVKVVTLPEGQDPADAPDGFADRLRDRRELSRLSRTARDRALGRPAGGVRARARGAREGRGLARAPGGAAAARGPARPPARDARWPRTRARLDGAPDGGEPAPTGRGRSPRARGTRGLRRPSSRSCAASPSSRPITSTRT